MRLFSWLRDRTGGSALADAGRARRKTARTRPPARRLCVEQLEDRLCPSAYSITDLGALPGHPIAIAAAINNFGQVVGGSGNGTSSAWLWTPTTAHGTSGSMIDLGTLGGTYGGAGGSNSFGQVVGWAETAGGTASHAFLWTPTTANGTSGSMIDLGTLGGTNSTAYAVNNATPAHGVQVVGDSSIAGSGARHAFLWEDLNKNGISDPGEMKDLGTLGGDCQATGINDAGQVVGYSYLPGNSIQHALLWQNGVMTDLGILPGGQYSYASSINGSGQVAGTSDTTGNIHAFLWQNGIMTKLQVGEALSINASSQLVGDFYNGVPYPPHAGLWQKGNRGYGRTDLNSLIPSGSGQTLFFAYGINDFGEIAAFGAGTINGQFGNYSYLLKPTASTLAVSGPTSVTAGVAFTITVTALDASGNVANGYTDTVHLTSTDILAKLPADHTFTAANKGVYTFTGVVLKTKGKQTITVTDSLFGSLTVSLIVDVL